MRISVRMTDETESCAEGRERYQVDAVKFIIGNNNTYYELMPGKDLLSFTEFNFSFFWEQCIEAGKTASKTGRLPAELMQSARNTLSQCHPYVKACIEGSFDSAAVDCIIAYICSSENIGLEELWARCISPKNNYESAIFRRISEYKTGRSVNQWINIVRINEYAKKKLDFIYDDRAGSDISPDEYRRRKDYFDLAFSIAANEMGFPSEDMPYVRKYSPSLAPESAFRMGKFSRYVYGAVSEKLSKIPAGSSKQINPVIADQSAMDAFSYIKDMERPDSLEMRRASMEEMRGGPVVYMPAGFKGIIDLEFDLLEENGEHIERCVSCGRYFIRGREHNSPYCSRVNPSGRTCLAAHEEQQRLRREAAEKARIAEEEARRAAAEAEERARLAGMRAKKVPVIIPAELDLRSQALYYNLSKCAGREMDRAEFEEWAGYLESLKDNIRNGDGSISQLEDFLRSAEKMYGDILKKDKAAAPAAPQRDTAYVPKSRKTAADRAVKWIPKSFDSVSEAQKDFEAVYENVPSLSEEPLRRDRSEPTADIPERQDRSEYVAKSIKGSADRAVRWIPKSFDAEPAPPKTSDFERAYVREMKTESRPVPAAVSYEPPKTAPVQTVQPAAEEHVTEDGRTYKPFVPKKYASLYEAMTDPKYKTEKGAPTVGDVMGIAELAAAKKDTFIFSSADSGEDKPKKTDGTPPARVIRMPDRTSAGRR
ncbi:MAG: DUF6076 domain-containing protein [Oscillospiraceae bacterium]